MTALDAALTMLPAVESGSAEEVSAALDDVAVVRRLADAALLAVTRVVTNRSSDPEHSVARQCGEPSAKRLIARRTGLFAGQVLRLQHLAAATSSSVTLTGATLEAGFPLVGQALTSGAVSVEQASAIVTTLAQAAPRCHPDDLLLAERALIVGATGRGEHPVPWTAEQTAREARALRERLDQDGVEPRADERASERFLKVAQRPDGMVAGSFLLPELEGATLLTALAAYGKPGTRPRFLTAEEAADELRSRADDTDLRTAAQRGADVLAALVARGLEMADAPRIGGAAPTLVVTVAKAALDAHAAGKATTDAGDPAVAVLEQTNDEIPASIAEQLVCDATVQILVEDDAGHPLHLGRSSRLFSNAIRRAAAVRDRGCVGCGAPPGMCQVHHITWWADGGSSDIENALTVCSWCHHEIHRGRLHPDQDASGRWRLMPSIRRRDVHRAA